MMEELQNGIRGIIERNYRIINIQCRLDRRIIRFQNYK